MVVVDSRGWVCVLWVVWVTVMGREVTINYVFRSSSICVGLLFFFFFLIKFVWVCYSQFLLAIIVLFIKGVNALFVPTFRGRFYFGPYISILPILVPNPINACYFSPFRQPTDGNG